MARPNSLVDDSKDGQDDEIDPNIELSKLKARRLELMKMKMSSQKEKLRRRDSTMLGRDNTMDHICTEMAAVEKQIKALTEASKHRKTPKRMK